MGEQTEAARQRCREHGLVVQQERMAQGEYREGSSSLQHSDEKASRRPRKLLHPESKAIWARHREIIWERQRRGGSIQTATDDGQPIERGIPCSLQDGRRLAATWLCFRQTDPGFQ